MFYFFSKKKFLIDYLGDFVDIHNHILPGIDDGAKTVDESIDLIKGFSEIGVKKFIATPHIMHNYYPNDYDTIHSAHSKVQDSLLTEGMKDITLDVAAEHMIDANFDYLLENNKVMPLRNRYLLIEMSYLQPPINFNDAIQNIASYRYFPILAHPERYAFLHLNSSKFMKYKKNGILLQLNLLSLGQFYGKDVQKKAHKLLKHGLIDYVASDVHNHLQLQSIKELQLTTSLLKLLFPVIEKTIDDFY
ncbi:histidinol phosphatase [Arenibacter sp. F26102]|uniref:tyrosine-protein phosphatase n=1 Tax=Arenibacter sp. F26102 TaxID=2926416 RepID=UPI001FF41FE2|nr:CpsB/CapC family capsule biosynthesis tyrosine phosphatase [Arenibacter sp. F26102]MCK0148107.1 histidinol phosphatase [Arenibacter sp. F26102]